VSEENRLNESAYKSGIMHFFTNSCSIPSWPIAY